jgi:hypothetical protein
MDQRDDSNYLNEKLLTPCKAQRKARQTLDLSENTVWKN